MFIVLIFSMFSNLTIYRTVLRNVLMACMLSSCQAVLSRHQENTTVEGILQMIAQINRLSHDCVA